MVRFARTCSFQQISFSVFKEPFCKLFCSKGLPSVRTSRGFSVGWRFAELYEEEVFFYIYGVFGSVMLYSSLPVVSQKIEAEAVFVFAVGFQK